jgi:hypothetical protein
MSRQSKAETDARKKADAELKAARSELVNFTDAREVIEQELDAVKRRESQAHLRQQEALAESLTAKEQALEIQNALDQSQQKLNDANRRLAYLKPIRFSDIKELFSLRFLTLSFAWSFMFVAVVIAILAISEIQKRQQFIQIVGSRIDEVQQELVSQSTLPSVPKEVRQNPAADQTESATRLPSETDLTDQLRKLHRIKTDVHLLVATGATASKQKLEGIRDRLLKLDPLLEESPAGTQLLRERAGWFYWIEDLVLAISDSVAVLLALLERWSSDLLLSLVVILAGSIGAVVADAWFGSEVDVVPLSDELTGDLKSALWVLVGAVAAVLLIGCANVANLLLARTATREREIALRTALGEGRGRVMRQLLTESLLLATISSSLGILLAVWGVDALETLIPETRSAESHANLVQSGTVHDVPIDGVVLAVTIGVTLLTGVLFGLAPMLHAWKQNLVESLNATGRGSPRNRAGQRVLHALVCGQVAGALVLLIAAVLMIQSFARLLNVDPGFEHRQLLTGTIEFSNFSYEDREDRDEVTRRLLERVEKIPGVVSVCGIHELPLDRPGRWPRNVIREDQQHAAPGTHLATVDLEPVTPNYFKTMQIPLLSGRTINAWDNRENPPVVIINPKLALRLWPDGLDPIGQKIGGSHTLSNFWRMLEIVGVVGDTRSLRLDQPGPATVYFPFEQMWPRGTTVLNLTVQTTGDPLSLAEPLREEVLSVTHDEPITNIRTLESVFEGSVANSKFQMTLLGIFAAVALVLAALGIYGVVSWWVTSRIREIGIRLALGAQPGDVMKQIVAHSLKLTLIGVAIGLALLLLIVALIASIIPARRATRVNPMTALRCE